MAWTWVRPADPRVLDGRPLLDLGAGDGQTLEALAPSGARVAVDRSVRTLRAVRGVPRVGAEADALPFGDDTFATVLAADLFHHLDDDALRRVVAGCRRVLRPGGLLVAWWYERTEDTSPDAPRYTRSFEAVSAIMAAQGLRTEPLDLVAEVPSSPTVGCVARR